MATLDDLKRALKSTTIGFVGQKPLSDEQYESGFDVLVRGSQSSYENFIIPQLSQLLEPLIGSRSSISVLEIGPGPKSIFGHLSSRLRSKIGSYTAFEPNNLFAKRLADSLCTLSPTSSVLPSLEKPVVIHQRPFDVPDCFGAGNVEDTYDVVLFCHSLYGMKSKRTVIQHVLSMTKEKPRKGLAIIFHRSSSLHLENLVCHKAAVFNTGVVRIPDTDEVLACFASFVAGFTAEDTEIGDPAPSDWRQICRALGCRDGAYANHLSFAAPQVMVAFTQDANSLAELTTRVPLADSSTMIKNWLARSHQPATTVKPRNIQQIQQCVQWALKHETSLTVIGGGHSDHCVWSAVVAIDMSFFDRIQLHAAGKERGADLGDGLFAVIEAGCKTKDIVRKTMAAGVTIPLGARPSVGAGLWLQGGIGHLARRHGLACDAIVGAVMVSVTSGQVLYLGHVPIQYRPVGAIRSECESDLLWAMRGAGTNFGIVISVTLKTCPSSIFRIRNWTMTLGDSEEMRSRIRDFGNFTTERLQRNSSADGYLYYDAERLHFSMSMIDASTTELASATPIAMSEFPAWGPPVNDQTVDAVGLFETELYVSELHGGHGGGKTSAFKRCVFLNDIREPRMSRLLVAALETCPTPYCYVHLLHGGGAVGDVAADATAFGCRNWDFACVVTGVWHRDQSHTQAALLAVQWVYDVVSTLLPWSRGAYSADLGPDPRDAALAAKAFGPNLPRLVRLKRKLDPCNVLAYTCPLPHPREQKLIILVTGESCAGKDFCAAVWLSVIRSSYAGLTARVVSISDATKREYAMATDADLNLLLNDRAYKEQHRPHLTAFFEKQLQLRPRLMEEHFIDVVQDEIETDVLIITGLRDEAPVVDLSPLAPTRKLLQVHVQASALTRQDRRGRPTIISSDGKGNDNPTTSNYRPSLIFNNDTPGEESATSFAQSALLPFLHEDIQQLASMVRSAPNFPRQGTNFRHVLGISQQPGGLALCTSLLQTQSTADWSKIDAVVSCEAGGLIYASPLAMKVGVPLIPIRKAGRLPPPTVSVAKPQSYISSLTFGDYKGKRIEIDRDALPQGASVVVVDDVISTGRTLCAMLQLLEEVGIPADNVSVMVVAELPMHRGRQLLRQHGFGRVNVQSLLVFDGT